MEDGSGNGHGHGNGKPYRALMEDEELSEQFQQLVSAAHIKGYTEEEIGFGLMSATSETLLANGEPECCVMQLLMDFVASFYEFWHNRMSDEEEWDEEEEDLEAGQEDEEDDEE